MMVLMAFKKQEKAKPHDTMSLASHYFGKRIILKAWEIQLKIVESWVKITSNPNQINQKVHPRKDPFLHPHLGSALFSFFPSTTQVLLDIGVDNLLSMPSLMKWDLSSLTDRWPSCYREGSARLLSSLDTRHCDCSAPGHISIWPRGLTIWRPTLAALGGDSFGQLVWSCPGRRRRAGEQLPHVTSVR